MSSNGDTIKVAVRVRPLIEREIKKHQQIFWTVQDVNIFQINEAGTRINEPYSFDHIFTEEKTNVEIYDSTVKDLVTSALNGFNSTIFAYGQTSSGKTYTMLGTETVPGIMQVAVTNMFEDINKNTDRKYLIRVSYIEIYNEKVNDLLDIQAKDLKVREDRYGNTFVTTKEEVASNSSQVFHLMSTGNKNRKIGCTDMNERSSRSHTILKIIIESTPKETSAESTVQISYINFVDLAGSERIAHTNAKGVRLKEGVHINKSLSNLSLVIRQLSDQDKFINFRDSKLTRLLQQALGGNAKTLIIATITLVSAEETNSTLHFAQRAKAVKNKPIINEIVSDQDKAKQYARLSAQYKQKLDEELARNLELQEETRTRNRLIEELEQKLNAIESFHGSQIQISKIPVRRHTISQYDCPKVFNVCPIITPVTKSRFVMRQDKEECFTEPRPKSNIMSGRMKSETLEPIEEITLPEHLTEDEIDTFCVSPVPPPEVESFVLVAKIKQLELALTLKDQNIEDMNNKIAKLQSKNVTLEKDLETMKSQNINLSSLQAPSSTPVPTIRKRLYALEESFKSLKEFTKLESECKEEVSYEERCKSLTEDYCELFKLYSSLQRENEDYKLKETNTTSEISELTKTITELNFLVKSLTSENNNLKSVHEQLATEYQVQVEYLKRSFKQREEMLVTHIKELEKPLEKDIPTTYGNLAKENYKLNLQLEELNKSHSLEVMNLRMIIGEKDKEIKEKDQVIFEYDEKLFTITEEKSFKDQGETLNIEDMSCKLNMIKDILLGLHVAPSDVLLDKSIQTFELQNKDVPTSSEIMKYEEEIATLKNDLKRTRAELDAKCEEITRNQENLLNVKKQLDEVLLMQKELEQYTKNEESLKQEARKSKEQYKELMTLHKNLVESLNGEDVVALNIKIEKMKNISANDAKTIEDLNKTNSEFKRQIQILEQTVQMAELNFIGKPKEIEEHCLQLNKLKEELEQSRKYAPLSEVKDNSQRSDLISSISQKENELENVIAEREMLIKTEAKMLEIFKKYKNNTLNLDAYSNVENANVQNILNLIKEINNNKDEHIILTQDLSNNYNLSRLKCDEYETQINELSTSVTALKFSLQQLEEENQTKTNYIKSKENQLNKLKLKHKNVMKLNNQLYRNLEVSADENPIIKEVLQAYKIKMESEIEQPFGELDRTCESVLEFSNLKTMLEEAIKSKTYLESQVKTFKEENEELKTTSAELKKVQEDLTEKINNFKDLEVELETLKEAVEMKDAEIKDVQKDIVVNNDVIERLKEQLNDLNEIKNRMQIEIEMKNEDIEQYQITVNDLTNNLENKNQELRDIKQDMKILHQTVDEKNKNIESINYNMSDFKNTLNTKQMEISQLVKDLENKEKEFKEITNQYLATIGELRKELSDQKETCNELHGEMGRIEIEVENINQLQNTVKQLKEDLNNEKRKSEELSHTLEKTECVEMKVLAEEKVKLELKLAEYIELEQTNEQNKEELRIATQKCKDFEDNLTKFKETTQQQFMTIKELEKEIIDQKEKISELQGKSCQLESNVEIISQLQNTIEELVESHNEEKSELDFKVDELMKTLEETEEQNKILIEENATLALKLTEYTEKFIEELSNETLKYKKLEDNLAEFKEVAKQQLMAINVLEKELTDQKELFTDVRAKSSQLEKDIQLLNQLQNTVEQLKKDLNKETNMRDELVKQNAEEKSGLTLIIDELRKNLQETEQQNKTLAKKIEDLEADIEHKIAEKIAKLEKEKKDAEMNLTTLNVTINNLIVEIVSLKKEKEKSDALQDNLTEEKTKLELQLADYLNKELNIELYKEDLKMETEQRKYLEDSLMQVKEISDQQMITIKELAKELCVQEKKYNNILGISNQLESEMQLLKEQQKEDLNKEKNKYEEMVKRLIEEKSELDLRLNELRETLQQTEQQNETIESQYLKKMEDLTTNIEQNYTEQISKLEKQHLEEKQVLMSQYESLKEELTNENKKYEELVQHLKKKKAESDSIILNLSEGHRTVQKLTNKLQETELSLNKETKMVQQQSENIAKLQKEKADLEKKLNKHLRDMSGLELTIKNLKTEMSLKMRGELKQENEILMMKLKDGKTIIEDLTNKVEQLKKRSSSDYSLPPDSRRLRRQSLQDRSRNIALESDEADAVALINKKEAEIHRLQGLLQEENEFIVKLQDELKLFKGPSYERIRKLDALIKEKDVELVTIKKELADAKSLLEDTKLEINIFKSNFDIIIKKVPAIEKSSGPKENCKDLELVLRTVYELINTIEMLQNKLKSEQSKMLQLKNVKLDVENNLVKSFQDIASLEMTISNLRAENISLKMGENTELSALKDKYRKTKEKMLELSQINKAFKQQHQQSVVAENLLLQENNKLKEEVLKQKTKIQELNSKLDGLMRKTSSVSVSTSSPDLPMQMARRLRRQSLQDKNRSLTALSDCEKCSEFDDIILQHSNEMKKMNKVIDEKQGEIEKMGREILTLKNKISSKDQELENIGKELEGIRLEKENKTPNISKVEADTFQTREIKKLVYDNPAILMQKNEEISVLKDQVIALKLQKNSLLKKINSHEDEIKQLRDVVKGWKTPCTSVEKNCSQCPILSAKLREVEEQIKNAHKEKEIMQFKLSTLEQQMKDFEPGIKEKYDMLVTKYNNTCKLARMRRKENLVLRQKLQIGEDEEIY